MEEEAEKEEEEVEEEDVEEDEEEVEVEEDPVRKLKGVSESETWRWFCLRR